MRSPPAKKKDCKNYRFPRHGITAHGTTCPYSMSPHSNLETKRQQNIVGLLLKGGCHLCGCTSGSRSYRHFVGINDETTTGNHAEEYSLNSEIRAFSAYHLPLLNPPHCTYLEADVRLHNRNANDNSNVENKASLITNESHELEIPMRSCMCNGNSIPGPFPLKVCEMCISDDARSGTGRIRTCGICGVVACTEDCSVHDVKLLEVTDRDEWNNAGCLECRGMESFSEMELFKRPNPNGCKSRATRVCTGCVELFSLFSYGVKYQFQCRYFKCDRLLIPSHIVELKRCLSPFPLSELPDELLNSIIDFLGGRDLFNFGLVCTKLFRKVETVTKEIVERFNHQFPTGPTHIREQSIHGSLEGVPSIKKRKVVYAEGTNGPSLKPPEDGKTWVGVLNQMEKLARTIFYFDYQIATGDVGAPMRYLRNPHKLIIDRAYSKPPGTGGSALAPYFESNGLSMRGGQVLVTRYRWHHDLENDDNHDVGGRQLPPPPRGLRRDVRSVLFATDRSLDCGIHRVIIKYNCFCEGGSLGSIGILRQQEQEDGSPVVWQTSWAIADASRTEEHVFGMKYDASRKTLRIYKKNVKTNKMEPHNRADSMPDGTPLSVVTELGGGKLYFAASLSSGSVGIKGNQLSIRSCNDVEWSAFLAHTAQRSVIPRRGRGRRGEDRLMRYLDHRARRAMAGNDEGGIAARIQVERMMDMMEREIALDDSDSDIEMHIEMADDEFLIDHAAQAR